MKACFIAILSVLLASCASVPTRSVAPVAGITRAYGTALPQKTKTVTVIWAFKSKPAYFLVYYRDTAKPTGTGIIVSGNTRSRAITGLPIGANYVFVISALTKGQGSLPVAYRVK